MYVMKFKSKRIKESFHLLESTAHISLFFSLFLYVYCEFFRQLDLITLKY